MLPRTTLTHADFQRHPLARKAFQWCQQRGRENVNAKLQSHREYTSTEEYKILEALNAIPPEQWPLWEKAIAGLMPLDASHQSVQRSIRDSSFDDRASYSAYSPQHTAYPAQIYQQSQHVVRGQLVQVELDDPSLPASSSIQTPARPTTASDMAYSSTPYESESTGNDFIPFPSAHIANAIDEGLRQDNHDRHFQPTGFHEQFPLPNSGGTVRATINSAPPPPSNLYPGRESRPQSSSGYKRPNSRYYKPRPCCGDRWTCKILGPKGLKWTKTDFIEHYKDQHVPGRRDESGAHCEMCDFTDTGNGTDLAIHMWNHHPAQSSTVGSPALHLRPNRSLVP